MTTATLDKEQLQLLHLAALLGAAKARTPEGRADCMKIASAAGRAAPGEPFPLTQPRTGQILAFYRKEMARRLEAEPEDKTAAAAAKRAAELVKHLENAA